MLRLIALIISIVLQLIAVVVALRLTKITKYKISWILISIGFVFMAFRRLIDLFQFMNKPALEGLTLLNDWIAVIISILIASGVIIIPEIFNYMKRAELARKTAETRVLNAIIATEEKERKRFAKDLHDGLGPLLSTVKMSVSALLQSKNVQEETEILKNTSLVINEAINSIKDISNNLSPHILNNFGLATAIQRFIDKFCDIKSIKIDFSTNLYNKRFNNNIETIIYRILCELVHNSIKHANAEYIKITLNIKNNVIDLFYDDDGAGFDFNDDFLKKTTGTGLHNIISRIKSLHGYYEFNSNPGKGFNAYISINIKNNEH